LKRRTITTLKAADIDSILDRLEQDAKPRVAELHRKAKAGELTGTDAWYQASYGVFTVQKPRDFQDFIRVIAYAYSWLPTNKPAACPTMQQFEAFVGAVRKVKPSRANEPGRRGRQELVEKTRIAIGVADRSRFITVSKVLHFWDPTLAPMFDVWVGRALKKLGVDTPKSYVAYWLFADCVIKRGRKRELLKGLNYRLLDELLFQLGKGVSGPEKTKARSRRIKTARGQRTTGSTSSPPPVTKMDLARQIYAELKGQPSAVVRKAFERRAGLTPNGANTYYYKLLAAGDSAGGGR